MREQEPSRAVPDSTQPGEAALHVASGQDATDARQRVDRIGAILERAEARDRDAELRDRDAEGRDPMDAQGAAIDRRWAGQDRDRAAEDRAELIELLQPDEPETPGDAGDLP